MRLGDIAALLILGYAIGAHVHDQVVKDERRRRRPSSSANHRRCDTCRTFTQPPAEA